MSDDRDESYNCVEMDGAVTDKEIRQLSATERKAFIERARRELPGLTRQAERGRAGLRRIANGRPAR